MLVYNYGNKLLWKVSYLLYGIMVIVKWKGYCNDIVSSNWVVDNFDEIEDYFDGVEDYCDRIVDFRNGI